MSLVTDAATDTLPKLLRGHARSSGRKPGMREKDRGIWQTHTWSECYGHVRDFALGLAAAGFARGDKLSVLGDNRARLYWAQMAAQALGGMSVPLYQDSIARELAFVRKQHRSWRQHCGTRHAPHATGPGRMRLRHERANDHRLECHGPAGGNGRDEVAGDIESFGRPRHRDVPAWSVRHAKQRQPVRRVD